MIFLNKGKVSKKIRRNEMKLFKNRCYNGGNHHKFEARYDSKLPATLKSCSFIAIEALKNKVYIKDVCVWCGKEIER